MYRDYSQAVRMRHDEKERGPRGFALEAERLCWLRSTYIGYAFACRRAVRLPGQTELRILGDTGH
jgi:hypothetical protein